MRTYQNPLLLHEVKFVIDETNKENLSDYEQRRFIMQNIVIHCLTSDTNGAYWLLDETTKNSKGKHDLSSLLSACQKQIEKLDKEHLKDILRDRLHMVMNDLPAINCEYLDDSFLTVYGADGEYDKVEISIHCDGDDGPRLSVDLSNQRIGELISQLERARSIIINNKLRAKSV